ncbi:ABC transporter ATP-binding protein [Halobellus sp. Atlit-38R]|jgi:ABC-type Fe3+/spermidine/putrescine transport system ATPase subunit|nr:ABC transporter ATP-binding protein [Halobellus sp. Atlit-38R]
MSFLEIDNLRKEFGGLTAVDGISLTVEEGEFITVVGPSGCGKSTTLLNVAGLQTPTAGTIRLRGQDLTDLPAYERDIGVVFQDYALFPHKTVGENIGFGLKMRGVDSDQRKRRVEEMLEIISLEGYAEMYPHECSGGEQQRVAVARALAFDPDLVLMDEPLSNLDKELRHSMRNELKRIQRETGVTTIYVTHNQTEALSMGDRLAVLNDGQVEQFGDPKNAYQNPETPFVAGFLGQSSRLDGVYSDGSTPQIETTSGVTFDVTPQEHIDDGDDVALFLRNELVGFATGDADPTNTFEGVVDEVDYQGRDVVYLVDVPELDSVVEVSGKRKHGGTDVLEKGASVSISIAPEDVIFTPLEGQVRTAEAAPV